MTRIAAVLAVSLLLIAGCGGEEAAPGATQDAGAPTQTTAAPAEETGAATEGAGGEASSPSELPTEAVVMRTSGGEEVEVRVEIADDDAERQRGLMERTELAESAGMLFIFGRERPLSFWMKDTLIPLSIAYVDEDGYIVDIQDMQPLDTTGHLSAEPAKYALEVNQGFFEERGIEVGDRVEVPEGLR